MVSMNLIQRIQVYHDVSELFESSNISEPKTCVDLSGDINLLNSGVENNG